MNANRRVVVITGGSAGVGRATARAFAHDDASVAVIARGRERLEATRDELVAIGARAASIEADVADADQVEAAASRIEEELGPIDVWVSNAMTTVFAPVHDTTPEEFRRATEVTYLGSVWGIMAALGRMRERDSGTIVQVGSALAYRGIPLQAAYCGSKHALQGFLESLRTELQHEGSNVRVTMVQLPALNTPQFTWSRAKLPHQPQPVPPIFEPEVAAEAIVWAASHPRRELMVGWPTVKAILGNAVAPGLADRYLAKSGFEAQQAEQPLDPNRRDNLFEPAPGNQEAHGPYGDRSKKRSVQLLLTKHRASLVAGISGATALAAAAVFREND